MSLMKSLGAVASAALETATAPAIQGETASNTPADQSTSSGDVPNGKADTTCRTSVTVSQGLPGFSGVPITIRHSSGPSGQFADSVQTQGLEAPITNLSTPRSSSVLTASQSNTNHEFIPHNDPNTVLSNILQDHNYALPKRDQPPPPAELPSLEVKTTPPVPAIPEPESHKIQVTLPELSELSSTIPPFPVEPENVGAPVASEPVCTSPPTVAGMLSKINRFKRICEIYGDQCKDSVKKPEPEEVPEPEVVPPVEVKEAEEENKAPPEPSNNLSSALEDSNNEEITRCICDFLHDDGFMIACDKCNVWQHVDCMRIDRADLPDNYLCEVCNPRWVSKTMARAIQTRKKELEDTPLVESDQDKVDQSKSLEIIRPFALDLLDDPLSPTKSSGKIKKRGRGRPRLSNGPSKLVSPTSKRYRKHSGKKGQNLTLPKDSPSKIGSRKRKSLEPKMKKRSYSRRNTITSQLSSPGSADIKSVDEHKENSVLNDTSYLEDSRDDSSRNLNSQMSFEDQAKSDESFTKDVSDANGMLASSESRRKRKQVFRNIPNGDLSPPHIIATNPSTLEKQSFKSRSPSFDKPPNGPSLSNTNSESLTPEPSPSAVPSLQISLNRSFTTLLCPYSSSQYLDKFEEAVNSVCSYSPELRAKLLKNFGLGNSSVPDFTPLSDNVKKWKMGVTSLEGGKKLKTLLAGVRVEPGEAIIEFIGKFMMHTAFIPTIKKTTQGNSNMISPEPFVFFHQVPKNGMCICIDCRKYGNDARFVRRSCTSNAEIRHVVGKGTIHVYVVATAVIDVDDEVTIAHEFKSVTHNTMSSVVHKYNVVPPPLPCACSDLETCKAVIQEPAGEVVHKKNRALISPIVISPENKERKRRMSFRRASLLEKEVEIPKPSQVSPPQALPPMERESPEPVKIALLPPPTSPPEESVEVPSPVRVSSKERVDGRITRARTVATVVKEMPPPPPPVLKRKVERNRSGMDPSPILPSTETLAESPSHAVESHKMTRDERKLQSVLKIIGRIESNQKKKERRQNQKKYKRDKKVEEHEIENEGDVLPPPDQTPVHSNKRKGRKRGRPSKKLGGKPQMISQRKSGSIADIRVTSTESDLNSADEAAKAGMSPLQENVDNLPHINESLDHASAKKRLLRQAISEESDPCIPPKLPSRPSSPIGPEGLAPLKNRRLARASMSSEGSNTPPSTPNYVDVSSAELDLGVEHEEPHHGLNNGLIDGPSVQHHIEPRTTLIEAARPQPPKRKWSCSDVSSAEEDFEDTYGRDYKNRRLHVAEEPISREHEYGRDGDDGKDLSDTQDTSSSPQMSSLPRKSTWVQVDAPEPVTDAIVLDYVRNPETYAKLTGAPSAKGEEGASGLEEEFSQEAQSVTESEPERACVQEVSKKIKAIIATNEKEKSPGREIVNCVNNVECSPKTPIQVKKTLSLEEYFKRKREGPFEEKSVTSYESDSSESSSSGKEVSSPQSDGDSNIRETLQFGSTPTLAEGKKEKLGKRLSKSVGIRVPDVDMSHVEPPPLTPPPPAPLGRPPCPPSAQPPPPSPPLPYTGASPRDIRGMMFEKHNLNANGHGHGHYSSSGSMTSTMNMPKQPIMGRRLSVPTPAALKQSGMPPLPPHLSPSPQFSSSSTPNVIIRPTALNATSNRYETSPSSHGGSSSSSSSYRQYRSVTNSPSNYSNHHHHHQSRNMLLSNNPTINSSTSGEIIGGVPVCNLIPPPPPPTNQGTAGPAFGKRFDDINKKFFPSPKK